MGLPKHNHHKPVPLKPHVFERISANDDPTQLYEAAERTAHLLVHRTRTTKDSPLSKRLVTLADREGLELLYSLWAHSLEHSLSRSLWRLYAIRSVIKKDPENIHIYYELGKKSQYINRLLAGLSEPPTATELCRATDEILSGAFTGDFDIALQRFAAFCRIISSGQKEQADSYETVNPAHVTQLKTSAIKLSKTADSLDYAATLWRDGMLD